MKETIKNNGRITYLLTGGAGFVGKNLTRTLLANGHNVISVDNFENSTMKDISIFFEFEKQFEFHQLDIVVDSYELIPLIIRADIVIHLAATVGVANATNYPVAMLYKNITGMINVLKVCNDFNKRLLISSSSEVYGWSPMSPFREMDELVIPNPFKTRFSYALSKIVEEYMAVGYYIENNADFVLFRLFNSTGPGQNINHNLVLPTFVRQAIKGEDITVYGDGKQTRCFCHVRESCEAILRLSLNPGTSGEIYNIGTQKSTGIGELANMVIDLTGSKSKVVLIPYREAYGIGFLDMRERVPDLTKIEEQIGWKAELDLEQIIKEMIAYERNV